MSDHLLTVIGVRADDYLIETSRWHWRSFGYFLVINRGGQGGPDFHPISRHTWSIVSDGWALYLPVTCRPDGKKNCHFSKLHTKKMVKVIRLFTSSNNVNCAEHCSISFFFPPLLLRQREMTWEMESKLPPTDDFISVCTRRQRGVAFSSDSSST